MCLCAQAASKEHLNLNDQNHLVAAMKTLLQFIFEMYTGGRPCEIFRHLRHDDLEFHAHIPLPWLLLVFLKPTTLQEILG